MKTIDAATIDAIGEIVNIGVGRAAGQLNQMTGSHIRLQVPSIHLIPFNELTSLKKSIFSGDVLCAVLLCFKGSFSGITAVVFPPESAAALVMLLTGEKEDSPDLDPMRIEALKEVGNIIINAVMGSIANVLSEHFTYSIPAYYEGPISDVAELQNKQVNEEYVLMARTNFLIEALNIEGDILLILEIGSLENLVLSIKKAYER
ncbi:MAG: chemotaxis protein CheX [Methanoregulaceae archaeon]|jgi:chemotaxis protein CheC|nr:chemotaxis protein CheX [Methanoregulaceae archaeon]